MCVSSELTKQREKHGNANNRIIYEENKTFCVLGIMGGVVELGMSVEIAVSRDAINVFKGESVMFYKVTL